MKVFIIGTGNVAKSLGAALLKAGHNVTGVLGRNSARTNMIARKLNSNPYSDLKQIPVDSDFYVIAIKDDAIPKTAKALTHVKGILLHTSGSVSMNVFGNKDKGVLYPVDSITGSYTLSFKKIPLCIEAGSEKTLRKIMTLASSLSGKIYVLDSKQRASLHIAAVFTNNFTNYMLGIAKGITDKHHLPYELLEKLAQTTIHNAFSLGPVNAQTGPAKRNDTATIQKHLDFLKKNKDHKELYELISHQISTVHNNIKKRDLKS